MLLRQLQEFDLQIQAINSRAEEMREDLEELNQLHDGLNDSLLTQKKQLSDTRAMMKEKEDLLANNEERHNLSKSRLNQVSNTREYNALEKEMETIRKMNGLYEEERESLREAIEGSEADVADKQGKVAHLKSQIDEALSIMEHEAATAGAKTNKLSAARLTVRNQIEKTLVRRYEFIAGRRPGKAVVSAHQGMCTGCNMMLPPQLYNELQLDLKILQCTNCQRILFYESEEDRARNKAG